MITKQELEELKAKHAAAQPETIELGHHGRVQITYRRQEIAAARERFAHESFDAFPDLERLARFGLQAKAFLEEHGDITNTALGWFEHDSRRLEQDAEQAKSSLELLLSAARALDQKNQPRASVDAGREAK